MKNTNSPQGIRISAELHDLMKKAAAVLGSELGEAYTEAATSWVARKIHGNAALKAVMDEKRGKLPRVEQILEDSGNTIDTKGVPPQSQSPQFDSKLVAGMRELAELARRMHSLSANLENGLAAAQLQEAHRELSEVSEDHRKAGSAVRKVQKPTRSGKKKTG